MKAPAMDLERLGGLAIGCVFLALAGFLVWMTPDLLSNPITARILGAVTVVCLFLCFLALGWAAAFPAPLPPSQPRPPEHFPDSPRGAVACLNAETGKRWPTEDVELIPDAMVPGCWLLTLPSGERFISYVGDHQAAPGIERIDP